MIYDPPYNRLLTTTLLCTGSGRESRRRPLFRGPGAHSLRVAPVVKTSSTRRILPATGPRDAKAPATFARHAGGELDWSLVLRTTFSLSKTGAFILLATSRAISSAWLKPRFASRERYSGTGTIASNLLPPGQPERTPDMSGAITLSTIRR